MCIFMKTKKQTLMKSKTPLWIIIVLLLLFIFWKFYNQPEPTIPEKPTQTISYEYANTLEDEYIKTRWNILNDTLNLRMPDGRPAVDTREFLFSLDTLKQYIEYVEYNAKKMGYTNLGIRIYNAAYPKDTTSPDPGFSTVFLMPAGEKIDPQKAGFFVSSSSTVMFNNNINNLEALNFAHAGKPPKEL